MLIYFLFFLFVVAVLKDFRKGVILYAPFKFMFSYGIPSHIGKFELDTVFTGILFVVWLNTTYSKRLSFPLKIAIISAVIGALAFSFNPSFSILILSDYLSPYLYLLMFFSVLKTSKDLQLFIKISGIYLIILNINALAEWMGYNVIGTALQSVMKYGTYWANDVVTRGSFIRLHSFVPHSIGYGVENMLFFSFYLMLFIYGDRLIPKRKTVFFMAISILGIFLSGSRSPLLGGILILLPLLLNKKMFSVKNLSFVFFASIVIVIFAGGYISTMYESLTGDANTDIGGASSWEMRLGQLEYSVYFWMQNFWFGHGHTFDIFQGGSEYSKIFGAESVWFPIMMKQGLIGMLAYILVTIDACICARKTTKKVICICLMLGWLIIDSATNLPGLNILFPLYFYSIYYKWDELVNRQYDFNNSTSI